VLRAIDSDGFAREDGWAVGLAVPVPTIASGTVDARLDPIVGDRRFSRWFAHAYVGVD